MKALKIGTVLCCWQKN